MTDIPAGENHETPEDVAWAFHPEQAAWAQTGFPRWADAGPWIRYCFSPPDAKAWTEQGFTAESAAIWFFYGFTSVMDAVAWRACGFDNPHDAHPWHELGFFPKWAAGFRKQRFTPEEADPWASFDIDPARARDLHDVGIDPEMGYEDMRRKGGDPGIRMKVW